MNEWHHFVFSFCPRLAQTSLREVWYMLKIGMHAYPSKSIHWNKDETWTDFVKCKSSESQVQNLTADSEHQACVCECVCLTVGGGWMIYQWVWECAHFVSKKRSHLLSVCSATDRDVTEPCELHWFVACICSHANLAVPNRMDPTGPTGSGTSKTAGSQRRLAKGMLLYDYLDICVPEDLNCRCAAWQEPLRLKRYVWPSLVFRELL